MQEANLARCYPRAPCGHTCAHTDVHTHLTATLLQSPSSTYQLRSLCNQSPSPIHTGAKLIVKTQDVGPPVSTTVIPFT